MSDDLKDDIRFLRHQALAASKTSHARAQEIGQRLGAIADRIEKLEAALGYGDDLPNQLLRDADEMEACGAGNEAANMRKLVKRLLDARATLSDNSAVTK